MIVYIGIDPGTRCGWAMLDEHGARLVSGVWDLAPRRHEGGGMRYVRLASYLTAALDAYAGRAPLRLAYEEVRKHMGTDAAHIYGGIIATIARECEERQLPYVAIPVGTIKKLATGNGRADKTVMCSAAAARWPAATALVTDDEADALWCAEALRQSLQ